MSATIHANSLNAYYDGRADVFTKRQIQIIGALERTYPMTDRQIMHALGYTDMNAVRPRITELIDAGVLREVGETKCPVTEKRVRICEIAPKEPPEYLPGFNTGGHRDDG